MPEDNEKTTPNSEQISKTINEVPDKVTRAENAVKSMEEAEKRIEEKIGKLEELRSERILGGGSEAGFTNTKQEQDQKIEMAKTFWAGSQIEKLMEKHGKEVLV